MKISFITFGCKLNQAETLAWQEELNQEGIAVVSENQQPDCFIINACAVTAKAERELRQKIHQIKRRYPRAKIIVTGCWLAQNKGADYLVPRQKLMAFVLKLIKNKKEQILVSRQSSRTRALVKIQDGCDNFCAYCIVPFLRGRVRSLSIKEIIQEIKKCEGRGFQEVVLVGTDLKKFKGDPPSSADPGGLWRTLNFVAKSDPPARLARASAKRAGEAGIRTKLAKIKSLTDLLRVILRKTTIPRIRLSSLWPTAINSALIKLMKNNSRLCPHLHLSMQSGSDKILRAMGRNYKTKSVLSLIKKMRVIPNLSLTADLIVGFPGETEKDFSATVRLVRRVKFIKVHIFRYSLRPRTRAAKMPGQISAAIKKQRSQFLARTVQVAAMTARKKFLGKTMLVLFEQQKSGFWTGLTDNYLRVYVKNKQNLNNQLKPVRLLRLWKDGFYGKIITRI